MVLVSDCTLEIYNNRNYYYSITTPFVHEKTVVVSHHRALLLKLSHNYKNQAQNNTVFVQQIKVDRVGFEPTTSAMPMPYPTGLDDRPSNNSRFWKDIKMIRLGRLNGYKEQL
jgi:hypothetical protein